MTHDLKRCSDSGEHWRNAVQLTRDSSLRTSDDPAVCWICPLCYEKAANPLELGASA